MSSKVKELRPGQMERDTKDSLLRTSSRAKVPSAGQMDADMKGSG